MAFVKEIFDQMFYERRGRDDGNQLDLAGTDDDGKEATLSQIKDPARYAPELKESKLIDNASEALSRLMGQPVKARFFHAICKPARNGSETPWHQDAAYWDPSLIHRKISVWVPLQDVSVENGCMQFIPRSHKDDIITHQSINNDPRIHGLEVKPELKAKFEDKSMPCPLSAGGATFHGGYTLHYAGPNYTDLPRRAIILVGELSPVKRQEPMHFPWLEEKQTQRQKRAAQRVETQQQS